MDNAVVEFLIIAVFNCLIGHSSESDLKSQSRLLDEMLNPEVYNKQERPGECSKKPTLITIDVMVNMISTISEINMDFTVDIYLRQRWRDERLAYTELNGSMNLGFSRAEDLWFPDTYFPKLKGGYRHYLTTPNILMRLSPDGSILYSQRLALVLACSMELQKFPLDRQKCRLDFMSYGHTVDEIQITWSPENNFTLNSRITLPDFVVDRYTLGNCTESFSTGTFGCVYAELSFTRQFGFYLISIYLPTLLIIVLSWVGFWIDYKSTPSRISLGLLTVLAITTQSNGTNTDLPRVSYVKSIDVWMAISMVFVAGALLEFAVVNVIARKQAERLTLQKEYKRMTILKRLSTSSSQELMDKEPWDADFKNAFPKFSKQLSDRGLSPDTKTSEKDIHIKDERNHAQFIDKASRVLFPALFILTTIIYAFSAHIFVTPEE